MIPNNQSIRMYIFFMILQVNLACTSGKSPENEASYHNAPYSNMVALQKPQGEIFWMDQYEYPNQKGVKPHSQLDFTTARTLCQNQGKRLCTIEEWKIACGEQKFVYGNQYDPKKCYTNQRKSQGHTSLMHDQTQEIPSGQYAECVNENQIYDLNGNLEEWVLDDWRNAEGNLVGGAWYTHWQYADCTAQYSREPDYRLSMDRPTDSAGVRCCWSAWEITEMDIQIDAQKVIQEAQKISSTAQYNPLNEIEIQPGIWVDQFEYPNIKGEVPLRAVSWYEAHKLCKENNKVLCPTTIWEKACMGKDDSPYPYGSQHVPNVCNDSGSQIHPSGQHRSCKSPYNVFDMTGSVWEWTDSSLNIPELQSQPMRQLKEIRGGSWFSDGLKSRCKPLVGYPLADAEQVFPDVGFRCCRLTQDLDSIKIASSDTLKHQCPTSMIATELGCIDQYEFPNQRNHTPKTDVTFAQASDLCREQGKHLCSNNEWLQACEGVQKRRWSYGNDYDLNACHHNAPLSAGGAIQSGSKSNCKTPNGVFDLTGNVWEWTADGQIRGGNWNFSEGMGQCISSAQPNPQHHSDEIGFRCCLDKTFSPQVP